jgi:hypothetical protein
LGFECGAEERVTDGPIAWPIADCPATAEVSFTDPDVTLNTAYGYEARPVDADRNPAEGAFASPIRGYGVAGTAVLTHGAVRLGDNFRTVTDTCPGECFPWALLDIPGVEWGDL